MGNHLSYVVRAIYEPVAGMPHLRAFHRYIERSPLGPSPWRWTNNPERAYVFTRRQNAEQVADRMGFGELLVAAEIATSSTTAKSD